MTFRQTHHDSEKSLPQSPLLQRVDGIRRTGGIKTTTWRPQRTDELVSADQQLNTANQNVHGFRTPARDQI